MTLFRNRYRSESARRAGFDYGSAGWYFVTICTHDRICHFGRIRHGYMCLSAMGSIVAGELMKTPVIRPSVELDEWIIMPNHVHAIIHLIDNATDTTGTPQRGVPTTDREIGGANPSWKPGCLGSIMNQWKTACTKRIRAMGYTDFAWQPRFHDRIIRDAASLDRIRHYIRNNPSAWMRDRNNPERPVGCSFTSHYKSIH